MVALLFADDSTVYLSGSSLPELVNIVNYELNILCEWFKCNKLSLNVDKNKLYDNWKEMTRYCYRCLW